MSCGKIPNSVSIRLAVTQAASAILATRGSGKSGEAPTPADFEAMAGKMLAFVLGPITVEQLDRIVADGGPAARARFLAQSIDILSCDPLIRNKLTVANVKTIRELIASDPAKLQRRAVFHGDQIRCIATELSQHGLQVGMSPVEIAKWTADGAPGQEG